jgi:phenylacetate-CoA ligase
MPGDTAYHMMPVGVTAGPVTLLNAFQSYGLQTFAVGNMEGAQRLEMMQRFKPNFISTGPVYLRRLTTLCQGAGIDPRRDFPGLKSIKIGTYGYDVDWAREMEEFWGCRLSDSYASTQAGAGIASTCEHGVYWADGTRGVMHVPEHRILLEVVNPETGENARDGEEGEAIITPLDKEAMPIIRFRTGDRVVLRDHRYCPCGRPFIGIEAGTVSRYDAMLKIRGMNLWPEAVDKVVFGHAEVEEYNGRVLVDGRGREVAQVLVEFKAGAAGESERRAILGRIEAGVKESTGVSVEAREAAPGTIEKFVYKEKRWKDMRKQGM